MERIQETGKAFKGERVILDGPVYVDCSFENCQVVITGMNPVKTDNCIFSGPNQITFEGPAFHLLDTLSLLYPHPHFQPVIEQLFERIRGTGIEWKS